MLQHRPPAREPAAGCAAGRALRRALGCTAVLVLVLVVAGPLLGQWRVLPVISDSMSPEYPAGSLVLATPKPADLLAVGDVVIFLAPMPGTPKVMHRIVDVDERSGQPIFRTKGDANVTADPWSLELRSRTAWQVRAAVPAVGWVPTLARQHPVAAALLVAGGLALLAAGSLPLSGGGRAPRPSSAAGDHEALKPPS
jgi:signal peptidase I